MMMMMICECENASRARHAEKSRMAAEYSHPIGRWIQTGSAGQGAADGKSMGDQRSDDSLLSSRLSICQCPFRWLSRRAEGAMVARRRNASPEWEEGGTHQLEYVDPFVLAK